MENLQYNYEVVLIKILIEFKTFSEYLEFIHMIEVCYLFINPYLILK